MPEDTRPAPRKIGADPVLFTTQPFIDKYGFGALRCSIDDLNGDNVETIDFPVGTTHALRLLRHAAAELGHDRDPQAGRRFGAGGSGLHLRRQPLLQPVDEEVPDGWGLTGLHRESGASQITTDVKDASVSIRLAAGDTVTCTPVLEGEAGGLRSSVPRPTRHSPAALPVAMLDAMSADEDRSDRDGAERRTSLAGERTLLAWWRTGLTAEAARRPSPTVAANL